MYPIPFAVDRRQWGHDPRWEEYLVRLKPFEQVMNRISPPFFGVATCAEVWDLPAPFCYNNNVVSLDDAFEILEYSTKN